MDRTKLQQTAAKQLADCGRLLCCWATGTGKSGIVIEYIKAYSPKDTLIVVPEQDNIKNWQGEFTKFDLPSDSITVICYASLHKYMNTHWDLLVLDEVPHIDTIKRLGCCSTMTAENVLALGAVVSDEEKAALESMFGEFKTDTISLSSAIDFGILPKPDVRILHLKMNNIDKTIRYNGKLVTEQQRYDAINERLEKAKEKYASNPCMYTQQEMFRVGNLRKRFLGQLKDEKLKQVCEKLTARNKRFLCFCSSIQQAELIGGDHAYTSKTPANAKLLDRFNNHEIDSLYVVGKLIEGQTLNDIDTGVITQLGGKNRITVQSIGRILRSKNPLVYVLVFDNTQDDNFLTTVTGNIPEGYIKHYNF